MTLRKHMCKELIALIFISPITHQEIENSKEIGQHLCQLRCN